MYFRQNVKPPRFRISLYQETFSVVVNNFVTAHAFYVYTHAFLKVGETEKKDGKEWNGMERKEKKRKEKKRKRVPLVQTFAKPTYTSTLFRSMNTEG